MNILENERLRAVLDGGGILRELYDKSECGKNLCDSLGLTGTACYTLKSDDITALPAPLCSPYCERNSAKDSSIRVKSKAELTKHGLLLSVSTDSEEVSAFGLLLDLNFLDKPELDAYDQLLPTSPYTSRDGRYTYCIFTRPSGKCLVACATTPADGWKIHYSPEQCGHYIRGFQFLSSFDRLYGGSGRKEISVLLAPAADIGDAYRVIGEIFDAPYVTPVLSGSFDGRVTVSIGGDADTLLLLSPDGKEEMLPVSQRTVTLSLPLFGKYTAVPLRRGTRGIDSVLWNGESYKDCVKRLAETVREPFHGDRNLCEGGCGTWFLIREMLTHKERLYDGIVKPDLAIVTGESTPYVPRRTIAPAQEGYAPYHIYKSDRIQEQFFGVSILLDAYRLYKDERYLHHAREALDELIDNRITEEGRVFRGETDYTTVTCPVIPVVDMALFFKDKDPARYEKYAAVARRMADYVYRRGFDFPTEGAKSEKKAQMEDGSISCTALTVLYVARFLDPKPEYIAFAREVLRFHNAFSVYSPDVRMYGSSFRWWETVWEGDADGPAICAGHAWTAWRSEALFWLGVLTKDTRLLLDSFNSFMSCFSKTDEKGNSYAAYLPDYLCGGGIDEIRRQMLTIPPEKQKKSYKLSHGYPENTDRSLSRYPWIRACDTWQKTAAVFDIDGESVFLRCHPEGNTLVFDEEVETLYTDTLHPAVQSPIRNIKIISLTEVTT